MIANYQQFFKGQKITMLGLGLLGRGIGTAIFLAKNGADLLITDLKTEAQLAEAIAKIKKEVGPERFKQIKFVLGEHRLEDFKNRDLVIKAAGVPLNSPLVAEAKKNKIPVAMDASLFAELVRAIYPERSRRTGVKIVGVTGTRGKSTVTHLLYEILIASRGLPLRGSQRGVLGKPQVFLGGNVRGLATLPLLAKVRSGDIVVMELDSWQLQGFGEAGISPQVAVFTNLMPDHQNYYGSTKLTTGGTSMERYFADKANIYRWQKAGDCLIAGPEVSKLIKRKSKQVLSQMIMPDADVVPKSWQLKLLGEHNRLNVALAVTAARALEVPEKVIKLAVEKFAGVPGRLEFVREIKKVKYYNDTTSTVPEATIAGLKALAKFKSKIILIGGGNDKALDYRQYGKMVPTYLKQLILLPGAGTDKIKQVLPKNFKSKITNAVSMPDAVKRASALAQAGDIVLLSPGATSFGPPPGGFKNEFDRGDQFVTAVNKLK
ncbi:MAG: UDP-N-acetylmuramoyl-L-alanine--D-glutamate ligase [Candidatus Vogelbacteria bacterium CG10_big_fil_rev_8_21_14_0_10_49_38]|uniref:UDP-N-acetylmuramoylalanine--D-glutamate ligase n=1 Tax=Candidatus Vogelbacteria bacterium CG10_big_fil_rev_8_21_14_0_10_49_38 TaxID=1975043 RepID=A0A2H0RJE4_9BACT|nr:MAG: UDP-N-acetylmuramoylalanine--D-glutamate ligase [bacterium CG10_49_38]PIR46124.1 MAG: UDP-N-acetylmuramoyl-L-alanine--D-glutamate ligase [Candidatus Vogelbacteria bacterium CG10_big_fil_rev_8_21_14_0_10_49_38]